MPAARADSALNRALQEHRVFISYSRKDGEFVHRLDDGLLACDRPAWVDWEGIPPTADWMQEIGAAINEAEAFAFVLSPDSIASPVCHRELEHAAAQNKRLIPILWRDVDAAKVPESLGKLNWVFFRPADDFSAALETLLRAVDTDLDWVHAHTRLLVRTHEWEARGQNASFALRGDDLKAAEHWLTLGPTKEPKPTELQTRYIIESRRVATRRRFALLGGAGAALVIIAVLGTVSFFVRREAQRQETIAVARRLTSAADLQRDQEPVDPVDMGGVESSLLLATEAMRRLASVGVRSLETDIAMRRGLAVHPRRLPLGTQGDIFFAEQIVFGLDGSLVAAMKRPLLAAARWDVNSLGLRAFASGQTGAGAVALSPDGRFLAVLGSQHREGVVEIFDLAAPEPFARPFASPGIVRGASDVALAPNAAYLAVVGSDYDEKTGHGPGWTRMWHLSGPQSRELPRLPYIRSLWFSPDGALLAGIVDERVAVWTLEWLQGGHAAPTLPIGPVDAYVVFSPDGKYLALQPSKSDEAVQIWSVVDWKLVREVKRDGLLAVSQQARYIAVRRGKGLTIEIIDTLTGQTAAVINARWAHTPVVFGADGQHVAIGSKHGAGSVPDLWRMSDHGSDSARIEAGRSAYAVAFSADETQLVTFSDAEKGSGATVAAHLREITGSGRNSRFDLGPAAAALTVSADGRFLAVGSTGEARVLATSTGKTVQNFAFEGTSEEVALSPSGAFVAVATDAGRLRLWQATPRADRGSLMLRAEGMAISTDGKTVVAVSRRPPSRAGTLLDLHVWSPPAAAAGRVEPIGTARSGLAASLCGLSPDGTLVAIDMGSATRIREVATGNDIGAIGEVERGGRCAFSADNLYVAVTGARGTVRIWDVKAQTEVTRVENLPSVISLAFSPRGKYLSTLQRGGTLRTWRLRSEDLMAEACSRLTRNLTAGEWRNYFGREPYHAACPGLPVPKDAAR